jgi:peptide deformylase
MTKVLRYPAPELTTSSTDVEIGKEADRIIKQLFNAASLLKWGHVKGLAAPQIGINKKVFVIFWNLMDDGSGAQAYLNPRIVEASKFNKTAEGCYSLETNRFDYEVKRPSKLTLEWQDVQGNTHRDTFTEGKAQAIAHEYDHLEGICAGSNKQLKETAKLHRATIGVVGGDKHNPYVGNIGSTGSRDASLDTDL